VAQLVEHHLAKVGVAGSNPVVRSRSEGGLASNITAPEDEPEVRVLLSVSFPNIEFGPDASLCDPTPVVGQLVDDVQPPLRRAQLLSGFRCGVEDAAIHDLQPQTIR
jgi:hypothetical protein